jgi:murein L,D-transpeptidase YcbB/YkuD
MKHTVTRALLLFIFFCISITSCRPQEKPAAKSEKPLSDWDQSVQGNFSDQSKLSIDSTAFAGFFKKYPDFKVYSAQIKNFYKARDYHYAWFENGKLIEQAANLTNRVLNLNNEGVYKPAPYHNVLDSLRQDISANPKHNEPSQEVELMLTSEYFVFANVVWNGMGTEASKSSKWFVPRKKLPYGEFLDSVLKVPVKNVINAPVYRQYKLLRQYLKKYSDLDALNDWPQITMGTKSVMQGDSSLAVLAIKKRLSKLGDYRGDTLSPVFNPELTAAVEAFQRRHGLFVSGVVRKTTLDEMNVPLKNRIRQIVVNMERSRWLPVSLTGDYLGVNIPEFSLHVYNGDSLLWSTNVVVGSTVHETTVFYGEMRNVVFSPYWNVPESIVRKEILPGIRKDKGYIQRHNMEITGYSNGLPNVRQKPGKDNSLGLVKFLFPNSYSIYLHDTPSKSLFGETSRAFSHGCIRVKDPAKLAQFLLKDKKEWSAQSIDKAMHSGRERYVTLDDKVPVFIAYLTAFVDRDGQLNFRKDIYKLDDKLAAMIMK